MKRQFFITKKTILKILVRYGGRRKYEYKEKYTTDKQYEVVFAEKENNCKWLTIKLVNREVMVTLTDDGGKVIQRDFFTLEGEKIGGDTDERKGICGPGSKGTGYGPAGG